MLMKTNHSYFSILRCTLFSIFLLSSCNQEPDFKVVRQQVLDQHDLLMIDGEKAMHLQMTLDTLGKTGFRKLKQEQPDLDTAAEQQQIKMLLADLNKADDSMNDWMHAFNPDAEGKSNHDAVLYFKKEKLKVNQIDSLYRKALTQAGKYLNRFHLAPDTSTAVHQHTM